MDDKKMEETQSKMTEKKRIVFLYTELAAYFLSCIKELMRTQDVEVHIVRWPLNKEAPFDFADKLPEIHFYDRKKYNKQQLIRLVSDIDPHLIYCSGWIDRQYVEVCKRYRNRIPVVGGLDTHWDGSMKQRILTKLSKFTVRKFFSHIWVAGEPQYTYARKLGFPENHILRGVYAADTMYFSAFYERVFPEKAKQFPRRFIYVGRYLQFKGIFDLWSAFAELADEKETDWELWCLGTGDLWEKRTEHPKIKHFGFVQPAEMEKFLTETGVFILPSLFEPWAVVVHEFCAAGFPVICSNKVGAATLFLEEGRNGFSFKAGSKQELKNCMRKIMECTDAGLVKMGEYSHFMSQKHSPAKWSATLLSLLE